MTLDPRIRDALSGSEPLNSLTALVRDLQASGWEQQDILRLFEANRQTLREAGREKDEDILMEIMDFVTGWCSPHVSLRSEHQSK